ncbi:MAG: GHKL domain-containing protein [Lactobacillus sp.]|jgi:two-component system sensor histidine kinase AgrC|nr:GHKL domain-containing protein [Lactobacillus sp.]
MRQVLPLQAYLWDTLALLLVLVPYHKMVGALTPKVLILRCLVPALLLSLFGYTLSDWSFILVILLQIAINRIGKIPIDSRQTVALLTISIVVFPIGNIISYVAANLDQRFPNVRHLIDWASLLVLFGALVLLVVAVQRFKQHAKKATRYLSADAKFRRRIIGFLVVLFTMVEAISLFAFYYQVTPAFQLIVITCFVIFIGITVVVMRYFILSYQTMQTSKNQVTAYKQQQTYLLDLEKNYQALRSFRHDYHNNLVALQGYITANDQPAAQRYIASLLQDVAAKTAVDSQFVTSLAKIKIPGLRALLLDKLNKMTAAKIPTAFEVAQSIAKLPGDMIDIVRIIGILTDNALEAVADQAQPNIQMALIKYNDWAYEFTIENTLNQAVDVNRLFQRGYSTKAGHKGLGLATVQQIQAAKKNLAIEVRATDQMIRFSLLMQAT